MGALPEEFCIALVFSAPPVVARGGVALHPAVPVPANSSADAVRRERPRVEEQVDGVPAGAVVQARDARVVRLDAQHVRSSMGETSEVGRLTWFVCPCEVRKELVSDLKDAPLHCLVPLFCKET